MIQTERDENLARVLVFLQCWGGLQRSCTTICCCILDKINEFNCPFHRKQVYPQNQAFAHAHIIAHFCNGFSQFPHPNPQGWFPSIFSVIFTSYSMMSHFSCDVPYIESKSEMLCFIFFRHITSFITEGYIYIYIYIAIYIYIRLPPPQTIRIKVF